MLLATLISSLTILCYVSGHGNMYYPPPWHDLKRAAIDNSNFGPIVNPRLLQSADIHRYWPINYPQPDTTCTGNKPICSPRSIEGDPNDWFTNNTVINGQPTLPRSMYDRWATDRRIRKLKRKGHPWASPGSAPTFGEGCGANGGNPYGCQDSSVDPRPYGSCCGTNVVANCGGYAYGKSAMEHAAEGLFDDAAVTTWKRGDTAEVIWASGANHMGGYAYRLCKVPAGGISKVTEQCFQDGHLSFAGDDTWIFKKDMSKRLARIKWRTQKAVRTRKGTTPKGSQWAKINFPEPPSGEVKPTWVFRDLVQVPQTLESGRYVLSFRWDSQNTPQVWNSCANINIV